MQTDYSQPSFYHFSQDSIELAKCALEYFPKKKNVLDLCAGCGIVGIEYALKSKTLESLTFIEIQEEFEQYLEDNIRKFTPQIPCKVLIQDIQECRDTDEFDLIVMNPPYFMKSQGRRPDSMEREICRFITDEKFLSQLNEIVLAKNEKCDFIFIIRNNQVHWDRFLATAKAKVLKSIKEMTIYSL